MDKPRRRGPQTRAEFPSSERPETPQYCATCRGGIQYGTDGNGQCVLWCGCGGRIVPVLRPEGFSRYAASNERMAYLQGSVQTAQTPVPSTREAKWGPGHRHPFNQRKFALKST